MTVCRRGHAEPAGPAQAGTGRTRLRRLLILLPWLMERGQVPVEEAAERFGVGREQLIHDVELAACAACRRTSTR